MHEITLPEPALSLFLSVEDLIDQWLPGVLRSGTEWAIGGGSVLASFWQHRASTDLDLFLPSDSGLSAISPQYRPEFSNAMASCGASKVEVNAGSLKFTFPSGRLEIVALDPIPPLDLVAAEINGSKRHILPTSCILAGKLVGPGLRLPPRDVFDIAVAAGIAEDSLACAVNHMESQTRAEVATRLSEQGDRYRTLAPNEILNCNPMWQTLLVDAPELAVAAIQDLWYREYSLNFERHTAIVAVSNNMQGETTHKFQSAEQLLVGLTEMGLRTRVLAKYGRIEHFFQEMRPRFAKPYE